MGVTTCILAACVFTVGVTIYEVEHWVVSFQKFKSLKNAGFELLINTTVGLYQ